MIKYVKMCFHKEGVLKLLVSAPTLVHISGLWSGSGLFWAKWSGFGPDFAQKSGFFIKIRKERLKMQNFSVR